MSGLIRLTTERLLIRDHIPGDLPSHHALLSDPTVMYYLPEFRTQSRAESAQNLAESITDITNARRSKYLFRMERRQTWEHIGEIGYTVTDFTGVGKLVKLWYFSFSRFWGKGYTTEALQEVLRHAFEENKVFRVSAGCIRENGASERVMQKCGMIKEADLRLQVWHDDRMKDRVEYRLLKDEYDALPK